MNLKKSLNQCLEVGTVLNHREKEKRGQVELVTKKGAIRMKEFEYFKFQISKGARAPTLSKNLIEPPQVDNWEDS